MTDPKYADLPGIAQDEPDVYETTDLPEADQTSDFYEEENESIERIHLSASEAFNKFKGKSLVGNKVDFSERISRRIRTGYDARSGDWELAEQGKTETPLQKYQRLLCEFKELQEDVEKIKGDKKTDDSCIVSTEQVQQALAKLSELRLEETLGADVVSSIADPQGGQIKQLLSQLEQFKTSAVEKPESESTGDSSEIVYKFNYRPEQARLQQASRVSELERRLHRLETVLGASSDKLSRLSQLTSKSNLMETAQHLSATASMLDSAQLDHIEGRLTALNETLDTIAEKRNRLSVDSEKEKMILELYEIVENSGNVSKVLPATIGRLKALEGLHTKATDFAKTLTEMENRQTEVAGQVQNNKALLQGVQESFANSLQEFNKTVTVLDEKIKALSKKK